MVGFVIVSHSNKLAEGVVHEVRMTAKKVKVIAAGGMEDNSYGTSYEKIKRAIDEAMEDEGVIVLCDMGSAVMTAEMVLDEYPEGLVTLANCSLVEGAITGSIEAECGNSKAKIIEDLLDLKNIDKF